MPGRNLLPPDIDAAVLALRRTGASYAKISKSLGIGAATACRIVKNAAGRASRRSQREGLWCTCPACGAEHRCATAPLESGSSDRPPLAATEAAP